ncbi:RHS repeat-associated core domain-containing protein, partial [Myroides odoratus]|uniref:RHS repeat-associated core domain-containing protein n=1 Tax=Myroides odoratus TaxID=256 RepID=UPI00334042E0
YRSYSPVLMRFTCPDSMSPFGAGGINAYAYCAGDPINLIDPSGHSAMGTAGLLSGGVISQGLAQLGAVGGIALGIIGIVSAVATFGASVAGMGVAMASISLTLSLAAEATGIASIAVGNSDPQVSANLGWASLTLGIAGSATGGTGYKKKPVATNLTRTNAAGNREIFLLGNNQPQGLGRGENISDSPFPAQMIRRRNVRYRVNGEIIEGTYLRNGNPLGDNSLLVHGHGERTAGTFITNRNITLLTPLNTDLDNGLVQDYLAGGPHNFNSVTYRAGSEVPNLMISGPNMDNLSLADSIRDYRNTMQYNFPHHYYAISDPNASVSIGDLVRVMPRRYTNIYLACCATYPTPPSA